MRKKGLTTRLSLKVNIRVRPDAYRRLRLLALNDNRFLYELIDDALTAYLTRRKRS